MDRAEVPPLRCVDLGRAEVPESRGDEDLLFCPYRVVTRTALSRLSDHRNARHGDSLATARSAVSHVAHGRLRRRASVAVSGKQALPYKPSPMNTIIAPGAVDLRGRDSGPPSSRTPGGRPPSDHELYRSDAGLEMYPVSWTSKSLPKCFFT